MQRYFEAIPADVREAAAVTGMTRLPFDRRRDVDGG
jgi:ABC-type glycerol-3-phosphate transport system permease component